MTAENQISAIQAVFRANKICVEVRAGEGCRPVFRARDVLAWTGVEALRLTLYNDMKGSYLYWYDDQLFFTEKGLGRFMRDTGCTALLGYLQKAPARAAPMLAKLKARRPS
jgi:hypothetical protein